MAKRKKTYAVIYSNIATRLSVCALDLLIVIANAILIGNHLLHTLKGMIRSHAHNSVLGMKIVFIEPITSAVLIQDPYHYVLPQTGDKGR
jgi:hypothetical protein